jgi:hypothetical protein
MDIIYELINGTVPSHPITISVDVRVAGGAVLTLHQLEYRGSHANRTSWQQSVTGAYVMICQYEGQFIASLNPDSWTETMVFSVVGIHAVIEKPTEENRMAEDESS